MTDDQTEMDRDDVAVIRALARAGAVLYALIAPDALHSGQAPTGGVMQDPFGAPTDVASIRQRYALLFNLPDRVEAGQEWNIDVALTLLSSVITMRRSATAART